MKEIIATEHAPQAIGPYSQAVRAGNLVFASGQIPIDPATKEFVAGGIAEALLTTALGLAVAVPAVWVFNYFTGKVDGFIVEMDNSASELIDYFIKNRTRQLKA